MVLWYNRLVKNYSVVSLFSGCGGMDLGVIGGIKLIWTVDTIKVLDFKNSYIPYRL